MQPIPIDLVIDPDEDEDDEYEEPQQIESGENVVSKRFDINKIGPLDYLLLDLQAEGGPLVHWLYLVAIENKWCNWQVILSAFDPSLQTGSIPMLGREIWSTFLYSDMEGLVRLCPRIISLLESLDVNYPVELTYTFGGQANPPPFQASKKKQVEATNP